MISIPQLIGFELLSAGFSLWSKVECGREHDRWVVYANLRSADDDPERALAESERILRRVLDTRLSARDWMAVVLCGGRVSHTVRPD
jgi:hypothetical protein